MLQLQSKRDQALAVWAGEGLLLVAGGFASARIWLTGLQSSQCSHGRKAYQAYWGPTQLDSNPMRLGISAGRTDCSLPLYSSISLIPHPASFHHLSALHYRHPAGIFNLPSAQTPLNLSTTSFPCCIVSKTISAITVGYAVSTKQLLTFPKVDIWCLISSAVVPGAKLLACSTAGPAAPLIVIWFAGALPRIFILLF